MNRTLTLAAWLTCAAATVLEGQAPPNDSFTNRFPVPPDALEFSLPGANLGASPEPGEPPHAGQPAQRSVWWSWLAQADGYAVVDTTNSAIATRLGVYVGKALSGLHPVDRLQDSGLPATSDHWEFEATPLQPYEIAVDGWQGAQGSVQLDIRLFTSPWIRQAPQETNVVQGRPANLDVWAVGKRPLQFQWQHKDAGLTAVFTNLPAQTSRVLNLPVTRRSDQGWYRVIIRNAYGQETSEAAWLGVTERPEIVSQPGPRTVFVGENPSFQADGIPAPLWYQWQFRQTNGTRFANLPGQHAPQLDLENVSTAEAGYYRLWVTNAAGEAFSDEALLTVVARPPVIRVGPTNQTVVLGDDVWFYVQAEGHQPITIEWWHRAPTNQIQQEVWTESYLHLPTVQTNDAGTYGVTVRNAYGATTANALLTVERRPPNDHFENRISFNEDETPAHNPWDWPADQTSSRLLRGFNKNATRQEAELDHAGQPAKYSVWWSFTPPADGVVTLDLRGTDFRPVVGVYAGAFLTTLARVAGGDSATPFSFFARLDQDYAFAVDGWQGAYGNNINLRVTFNPDFGPPVFEIQPTPRRLELIGGLFGAIGAGGEGCRDATFTARAFSLSGAVRYQWEFRPAGSERFSPLLGETNATLVVPRVTTANGGEYRVVAINEQGDTVSETSTLTVTPGPVIPAAGQPRDVHTNACARVEFTVEAESCSPRRYAWRRDGVPLTGGTNAVLVLTNVGPADVGAYDVIVGNANLSVTSSPPARLTLDTVPRIAEQPASLSRKDCDRAEFSVRAVSSCPLQYYWLHDGTPIPGATGSLLVLTNLQPGHAGAYQVVVSNQFAGVLSQAAILTIATNPVIRGLTLQPAGRPLRLCETARLTVSTDPSCTPLTFEWFHNNQPIRNSNTNALPFEVQSDSGGEYHVRVQNRWSATTSQPVVLTVDARPELVQEPLDYQRIRAGAAFSNVVVVTSCGGLGYQWEFKRIDLADFRPVNLGGRFALTGDGSLVVAGATTNETGFYRVQVGNTHSNVVSRQALIRVVVPPANDDFARSIHLGRTNAASAKGHNEFATAELAEPPPVFEPPTKTVWWSWTAPFPCVATVDFSGSDLDTLLAVQAGTQLTNLLRFTYDDNGSGVASRAAFMAGRDRTVHFQVDGKGGGEGTNLVLLVTAQEITSPPVIPFAHQPKDTAAKLGATTFFDVQAYGSPEMRGQWYFNGSPIPGATNLTVVGVTNYASRLTITNVQDALEGVYRIALINEYGAATSRVATLTTGSIVWGLVTDATRTDPNGRAIPVVGARVWIGDISDTTDENGNYQLVGVRLGQRKADFDANSRVVHLNQEVCFFNRSTATAVRIRATREGFYDYDDDQFEVSLGDTVEKRFSMSPIFDGRRFVLNWAELPPDLDFWLRLPPIPNAPPWIYYGSKGNAQAPPFALLDVDVADGYGPETLTIREFYPGTYSLYVNRYLSSAGSLSQSLAKVIAYVGGQSQTTAYGAVEVPPQGAGAWWHVCDLDGTTTNITWINTLLTDPPVDPDSLPKGDLELSRSPATRRVSLHTERPLDVVYAWGFGDGTPEAQAFEPCHRYPDPGFYTVSLRMRDQNGNPPKESTETKVRFIEVVNLPPTVQIVRPADGWLVRAGDPVRCEAVADGRDDPVAQVEYFLVQGGATNRLGAATLPPYGYSLPTSPGQSGELRIVARATDQHGAIGWSTAVHVRVLDLTGEILILRNRPSPAGDSEVNAVFDQLATIEIPVSDDDGFVRHRPPTAVRVLDQEGLHFDLVSHFRLIVWDDCGLPGPGVSSNTVAVLQQAWQARIPLYLIGAHLAGDAISLAAQDAPEAVATWLALTRLAPTGKPPVPCEPQIVPPLVDNELFHSGWYGYSDVFDLPHLAEQTLVLTNASQLSGCTGDPLPLLCVGDAQVRAACDGTPVLVRTPRFGEENPLRALRLSQTFLIGGSDDFGLQTERQALLRNAVLWLLGNYCENISTRIIDAEGLPERFVQTCDEFVTSTLINNNGGCDAGGLLVTNTVPDGFLIRSVGVVSDPPEANVAEVERRAQQIVFGFGRLRSSSRVTLEVTLRACRPGVFTNVFEGVAAHRRPAPWLQTLRVEGAPCTDCNPCEPAPLRFERGAGVLTIRVAQGAGCLGTLESSTDLITWQPAFESVVSDEAGWRWDVPLPGTGHRFYRLRMGN